ncbi:ROK family protein [Rubrolithibacter danxiaensis]|uniref:ROK family protein n=1 Tax=Rubrolithibacter danxiaensis TaxID=3390805 RepID=UPI003BF8317C
MSPKGSTEHKHDRLKQRVLKELYFDKMLSCADLSLRTKKSLPVVTKVVAELIEENYVIEYGFGPSSGGRRPLMYSLKPHEKLIVAVAIDQLSTHIVIYDLMNNQVSEIEMHELELENNPDALPVLTELINSYISQSGFSKEKIIGIGISMPGFVDVKKGINYSFLEAGGQSLQKYISDRTDLPVYIDNDSCLIALAELRFGLARLKQNVMVVNVAWGIGLGMILNGEIFRGHTGFAGEFSHIPTSTEGKLCNCGKRGCLETEASLLVVAKKALDGIESGRISSLQQELKDQSKLPGDVIMEAANKGDQFAIELLSDAGYAIGIGLAILIHIINPAVIILSGRGAAVGKILSASIQQALNKYAIPRLADSTELQISQLGSNAALIGAASLVIECLGRHSPKSEAGLRKKEKHLQIQ